MGIPSGELLHSNGKIHHAINGKIHYFNGHFQVRKLLVYQAGSTVLASIDRIDGHL